MGQIKYIGFIIEANTTGNVIFDFRVEDSEIIIGNGKSIDDCKIQIDELLLEYED